MRTLATAVALAWLVGTGVATATEPLSIDPTELAMPKKVEYKEWLVKMAMKYDRQAVRRFEAGPYVGPGDMTGELMGFHRLAPDHNGRGPHHRP